MGRRSAIVVSMIAVLLAGAAAARAERPPAPLQAAEVKTANATNMRVTMTLTMRIGGEVLGYTVDGVERLRAHQASMVVDLSKLAPAIGKMQVLAIGPRYYVHYRLLDVLHAKRPRFKPWIVESSVATVGFDPWSLAKLPSGLRSATDFRVLRTSGGTTSYGARIDLASALTMNPRLKQMLGQLGTAVSQVVRKPMGVELDVGPDGYLHRVAERFAMSIAGDAFRTTIVVGMSDFGVDPGPLVAPPANQVMTLSQFKRLVHG
jgi:hypothetical protein